MIVVDASVLVDASLHNGPASVRLDDEWLCAPHLIDAEFMSALRWQIKAGNLEPERAGRILGRYRRMQILRYEHLWLMERVWELRENVTPYDALYVALAEVLDEVLVTVDARLAKAPGIRARVEVLPLTA